MNDFWSTFRIKALASVVLAWCLLPAGEARAQTCIDKCNKVLAIDIREKLQTSIDQSEYSRLVTHYCDEVREGNAGQGNVDVSIGKVQLKGGESSSSERYRKLCQDYDATRDMKYASDIASAYIVPGNLKTVHEIYKTCMAAPECGDALDLSVEDGAGDGRFVRLWVTWHKRIKGPDPVLEKITVQGKATCESASFGEGGTIPVGQSSIQCTRTDNSRSVVHVTVATSRGEVSDKFGSPCVSAGCVDNRLVLPDNTTQDLITASSSFERMELGAGAKLIVRDDLPHMKSKITLEIHHLVLPKSGSGAYIGFSDPSRFSLRGDLPSGPGAAGGHGKTHDRPRVELIVHKVSVVGSGRRPTPTELASALSINFDGVAGGNGADGARGNAGAAGAPGRNGRHSCNAFGCRCRAEPTDGGAGGKGQRGGNGGNAGRGGNGADVTITGPFKMGELFSKVISNRGGQPGTPGRGGAGGAGGPGGRGGAGGGGHCGGAHPNGPRGPQGDVGATGSPGTPGEQGKLVIKEGSYR